MTARRRARVLAALLASLLAVGACSSAPAGGPEERVLTVSAAASLTEVFTELGEVMESENPGVTVRLNFGGSSALAEQIVAGAPVDVFAAASTATMATVVDAGDAANPVDFATNTLAVAVPIGNPAGVADLTDLAAPRVSVVLCAPEVPCGAAAANLLERNGIDLTPVSLEPDVKSVLAKIITDEADAGIVYTTDIKAAGEAVDSVGIPAEQNVSTTYPIAVTASATDAALSASFVALVTSDRGQQALADAGFGPP